MKADGQILFVCRLCGNRAIPGVQPCRGRACPARGLPIAAHTPSTAGPDMSGPYRTAEKNTPFESYPVWMVCFCIRYSCARTKDIDFSILWAVQFDKLHKNRRKRLATGPCPWYDGTHREQLYTRGIHDGREAFSAGRRGCSAGSLCQGAAGQGAAGLGCGEQYLRRGQAGRHITQCLL